MGTTQKLNKLQYLRIIKAYSTLLIYSPTTYCKHFTHKYVRE